MLVTEERAWTHVVLAGREKLPARPDRARQTVLRILGGSLCALLVLLLAGYLTGARIAEQQALSDARRFTQVIGDTVIGPHLTPALLDGDPRSVRRLDRVVRERLVPATSIERVKVWSASGSVLYSDAPNETGGTFELEDDQRQALLTGETTATVSSLGRDENVTERALGSRLIEVYTTVPAMDGELVLFEAYLGYDAVQERRDDVFRLLSLLAVVLLALFAIFQVWLSLINLRWLRSRQRELDRCAAEVSDRERRGVARDLHDGVVQDLVGTSYVVAGARASMGSGDLPRASALMDRAAECLRASVQALRSTLVSVYPPSLAEGGLGQALDDLVQPLRTRGVVVNVEDEVHHSVSPTALEATYRAAQEAVRNVCHHAHATQVRIRVFTEADRLCLVVRDDGVGIPPERLAGLREADGHLGLRTLVDAARDLDGTLQLSTCVNSGSEIRWEIPL